jgi:hypothetical protein
MVTSLTLLFDRCSDKPSCLPRLPSLSCGCCPCAVHFSSSRPALQPLSRGWGAEKDEAEDGTWPGGPTHDPRSLACVAVLPPPAPSAALEPFKGLSPERREEEDGSCEPVWEEAFTCKEAACRDAA